MMPSYTPKSNRAEIHLTYKCNLGCKHCNRLCFLPPQTADMTLDDVAEFCRQADELKWKPTVLLIGGEPTLHSQFFQCVELFRTFHGGDASKIEVWSNGYSIATRQILARVQKEKSARIIEFTQKPSGPTVQSQSNIFVAPCDFGEEHEPCGPHSRNPNGCGISVDHEGYTTCAVGGAICAWFGLPERTKRLARLFDEEWASRSTRELCRRCGSATPNSEARLAQCKIVHGSPMSASWQQAVEDRLHEIASEGRIPDAVISTRPYLLYVSCPKGKSETELFGADRQFDVAINDYTGSGETPAEAEYRFSADEWKFCHVHARLGGIVENYRACGFFDDDIGISTADLNRLFRVGDVLDLSLWQAALSSDSHDPWKHLFQVRDSLVRRCNVVEIMMPIFSREALRLCWDSFPKCYSAWGLDSAWPTILKHRPRAIVDAVVAKHLRPVRSQNRRMPNGKTPNEENAMILREYGLRMCQDGMRFDRRRV